MHCIDSCGYVSDVLCFQISRQRDDARAKKLERKIQAEKRAKEEGQRGVPRDVEEAEWRQREEEVEEA